MNSLQSRLLQLTATGEDIVHFHAQCRGDLGRRRRAALEILEDVGVARIQALVEGIAHDFTLRPDGPACNPPSG